MELYRQCRRPICGGQIEWSVDIETGLEGTCLQCGRPAFRRKVDRTPPDVAELVENSLLRENRKR
jgi:hypothetical protein